jgi:hypothetical protein
MPAFSFSRLFLRLPGILGVLLRRREAEAARETAARAAAVRQQIDRCVVNLLREVFPERTPFQYDTALSFLQPSAAAPLDPADPVRLTLFFPRLPLAIDVLGPEAHREWEEARDWTTRDAWERLQERRAQTEQLLSRYRVPYLLLTTHDPLDPANLRQRVRECLGRYP